MPDQKIKLLDQIVIDQIAAGEVVSRPASVIKEFVENSIDAGAKTIGIDIVGGGLISLVINDDGVGISPRDMPLALTRHATSKFSKITDFDQLYTLGFRGEALASIASVSRLKLTSKARDSQEPVAYVLDCNGGYCSELKKAARNSGTTIEVSDIFYNVPARRKFLKKEITEFGHIADVVEKFIFSFPEIRFSLTHNNKKIYNSPGNGSLLDAITALWPKDISSRLIEINYSGPDVSVRGYSSSSLLTRSDKTMQVFYVNRRNIYNSTLTKALDDGYRNLLENHRYPLCVLFIDMDPKNVDVNVHPAKREVKFVDTSLVYNSLRNAVTNTLSFTPSPVRGIDNNSIPFSTQVAAGSQISSGFNSAHIIPAQSNFSFQDMAIASMPQRPAMTAIDGAFRVFSEPAQMTQGSVLQVMDTYLIHEQNGTMVMYDQHALHERILFEQLKTAGNEISSQRLLIPEMIFLSKAQLLLVEEFHEVFSTAGFEIEFFGADCLLVRALPSFMRGSECVELFSGIMSDIIALKQTEVVNKIREDIYKIIACRSAIKAGDKLSVQEIHNLLRLAAETPNIQTCPHGRPTTLNYSRKDLDKLFHRI